jgi:hypothetical protein
MGQIAQEARQGGAMHVINPTAGYTGDG